MGVVPGNPRSYRTVNREAWVRLARQGNDSSKPVGPEKLRQAREVLDPHGWIDWAEVRHVLCVASGGGQQAPLFAALDCRVVSADLCPDQLYRDAAAADRYGLELECVEADMQDLSSLYGRDFDLVYQAVSSCYVPNVRRVYTEIGHVLRPRGFYHVEHWNPASMQLGDDYSWTGRGYELVRPCISGSRYPWRGVPSNGTPAPECWHYMHSLTTLIGGLCDAGFQILHFSERGQEDETARPGSEAHVHSFVRPFFSIYARKEEL